MKAKRSPGATVTSCNAPPISGLPVSELGPEQCKICETCFRTEVAERSTLFVEKVSSIHSHQSRSSQTKRRWMHRQARSGVKHLDSTEHLKGEGVPATRIMCRRARYAEGIAVALAVCIIAASVDASDPELTAGFAAPGKPNVVDGNYFTFKGFRDFAAEQGSFGFSKANPEVFPALQGLGVSFTILEYYPNTTDPVHTHPRGTELLYVISGTLEVGLVDTNATLYTQTLQQGDVFVFPKGLLHYHVNLSQDVARSIAAYSSSDPGTLPLTKALFASGLPSVALELAFKVPASVINQLQAPWQEDTIVTTNEASTSSCSSYSW